MSSKEIMYLLRTDLTAYLSASISLLNEGCPLHDHRTTKYVLQALNSHLRSVRKKAFMAFYHQQLRVSSFSPKGGATQQAFLVLLSHRSL